MRAARMQATPGRQSRTYADIQRYILQRSEEGAIGDAGGGNAMARVLARLNSNTKSESARSSGKENGGKAHRRSDGGSAGASSSQHAGRSFGGRNRGDGKDMHVKAYVLQDLRGRLAATEQKLRMAVADGTSKSEDIRKLEAKVVRLEKDKIAASQRRYESLPKGSTRHARSSTWGKVELDVRKRDAKIERVLQHYHVLEEQYTQAASQIEDMQNEIASLHEKLAERAGENENLKEQCASGVIQTQSKEIELLDCMRSLHELSQRHQALSQRNHALEEAMAAKEREQQALVAEHASLQGKHERVIKEKLTKDRRVTQQQKKLDALAGDLDTLKKRNECSQSEYNRTKDRMNVLRRRSEGLEAQVERLIKERDAARAACENKEQECRLMAQIIHDAREASDQQPAPNADPASDPPGTPPPRESSRLQGPNHEAQTSPPANRKEIPSMPQAWLSSPMNLQTSYESSEVVQPDDHHLEPLVCSPDSLASDDDGS